MTNPHAAKWIDPRRLVQFTDAISDLANRSFPDLSPADVHLCYNLLAQTIVAKFAVASHEDKTRQEHSDAPKH